MVPCLHQGNVNIKRKLRVWGAYKCNPFASAINPLAVTGPQSSGYDTPPYILDVGNFEKFGATYRHGTVFAPKQCSYEKKAKGEESLKM